MDEPRDVEPIEAPGERVDRTRVADALERLALLGPEPRRLGPMLRACRGGCRRDLGGADARDPP